MTIGSGERVHAALVQHKSVSSGDGAARAAVVGPRSSRCRNDMSGYLSGHAILSSGVRGRKGSCRKGGKGRERVETDGQAGGRGGGEGSWGRSERNEGEPTEEGREERERAHDKIILPPSGISRQWPFPALTNSLRDSTETISTIAHTQPRPTRRVISHAN